LVADILALIDAVDAEKVHLVGHDWGAIVAWLVAARAPERLVTLTAMSVPHLAAFFKAVATSRQALASWYALFFQLPLVPEAWLLGRGGRGMTWVIGDYGGQSREALERDARGMAEPGAMTAALHWYRAMPLLNWRDVAKKTTLPTMFIWSDGDVYIKDKGVRDCAKYVSAEYRFETLHGTHWMADEQPDAVADLLVDWFAAHPI
jgi:pimeloyl-ACP methyl ester carboxylesterase